MVLIINNPFFAVDKHTAPSLEFVHEAEMNVTNFNINNTNEAALYGLIALCGQGSVSDADQKVEISSFPADFSHEQDSVHIVVQNPDGKLTTVTIDNDGNLSTTEIIEQGRSFEQTHDDSQTLEVQNPTLVASADKTLCQVGTNIHIDGRSCERGVRSLLLAISFL